MLVVACLDHVTLSCSFTRSL